MKPSLVLHLLTVSLVIHVARSQQQQLTLAVFLSGIEEATDEFTGILDGTPFLAAVEFAVDLINNRRADLLPEFQLKYTVTESQCQAGPSVRGFIQQIDESPTKIMILGADCSTATEPVAELAPFWNLVQISPVSTSPRLSDKGSFSTFLRTVSSDAIVAMGIVDLMVMYDWSRSAVISQQEFIFTSTFSALQSALSALDFDEPREFTFNSGDNPEPFVDRLSNSPTRIIFLNTYPSYAREILCQAFHLGMTHSEGYQWLLFGWYPDRWWVTTPPRRGNTSQFVCSTSQLETVLESAFSIDHFPYVPPEDFDIETDLGITRREFDTLYDDYLERVFPDVVDRSLVDQVPLVVDSVFAAALALNATQGSMDVNGEIIFLDEFTYEPESKSIATALYTNALDLNFTGVSGPVSFDDSGDRSPNLRFFQYQRNSSQQLELVSLGSGRNFLRESVSFPSGVPEDEEFVFISLPLFIVWTILACVGIILSFLCLAINFLFINRKVVKFSSPFLNVPIVVGIIVFFIEVILFGVDENIASRSTVNALCMTRIWIASLAFSLVFGTILVKTWRVYFVFHHTNRHKKGKSKTSQNIQWLPDWMLEDWFLLVMVGILLIFDVVFLIPVTSHPDARLELTNEEISSNDRSLPQIIALCKAEDEGIWLGLLLAYKGLLLITGIFLAFETRKANLPEYIDSKLIGMSVYGILILSLALTAIGILLEEHVDVHYALIGILIILGNTFLLALIFAPKVYSLWKDPQGLRVTTSTNRNSSADILDSSSKETITLLSQEAEKLRNDLKRLSMSPNAIQELSEKPPLDVNTANGKEFTNGGTAFPESS